MRVCVCVYTLYIHSWLWKWMFSVFLYPLKKCIPIEVHFCCCVFCCVSGLGCADEQRVFRKPRRLLDISATLEDTASWVNTQQFNPCNLFHCSFTFMSQSQIDTNWTVQLLVFCDRPLSNRVANKWCCVWKYPTTRNRSDKRSLHPGCYCLCLPTHCLHLRVNRHKTLFHFDDVFVLICILDCLKYFSFHWPPQDDVLESRDLIFTEPPVQKHNLDVALWTHVPFIHQHQYKPVYLQMCARTNCCQPWNWYHQTVMAWVIENILFNLNFFSQQKTFLIN